MHARFEIPVPRKNRSCNQIVFVDRFLDVWMQRSRVADARRAAVTDEIEPELVEIFLQPGFLQVIGNRSEEHTSELQSHSDLVCRLLLEKKKIQWFVTHH